MAEDQPSASEVGFTEGTGDAPALPKSSVLRLRGLPFSSGEDDVRQFFSEFDTIQVVVCRRGGRSTGEGYVQLDSPDSAADAIAKLHRQTLGHRYIEVFESSEADLATAKSLSMDRMRGFVIRLRGLPYTSAAQDVLNFFGPTIPVVRGIEGVVFTYAPDGRPTGEAFVELQSEEAQREALKKHKESIGSRYIELFVSTKADMIQAIQQNRLILGYSNRKRWLQQQGIHMGPGPGAMHPAHMQPHHPPHPHYGPPHHGPRRHVPYGQAGVEEVTEMMSGFNMGPGHAVQMIGPGGQIMAPGTYQLEVPRGELKGGHPQQRFPGPAGGGYPGRGGRGGGGGARGPGPAAFQGRGPAGGMMMAGRGMQQYPPVRPPPQGMAMGMAPLPPAARQTAQVVPVPGGPGGGAGGGANQSGGVMVQDVQQQQSAVQPQAVQHMPGAQYIIQQQPASVQQQYEQQQWGGQVLVSGQPGMQQAAQQQQAGLYGAGGAGAGGAGIPGAYTLTTSVIQVPGGAAGGGGYPGPQVVDYQQVHSLPGLDAASGAASLQGSAWAPHRG